MGSNLKGYEKAGRSIIAIGVLYLVAMVIVMIMPGASEKYIFGALILFGVGVLHFFIGKAIKAHKNWGKIGGIIIGILYLPGFPIGTLIGIYIIYSLLKDW